MARGAHQVVFAGELARFGIVNHQDVRVAQRLAKLLGRALDPIIHRVQRNDFGAAFNLMQNRTLQRGIDIRQKNVTGRLVRFGKTRLKIREDIEFGGESRALVHIFVIAPGPEKCLAGSALESQSVHAAPVKNRRILLGKIISYDSDEIYVSEETRGYREVCGRAAQHAIDFPERRFDSVKRDRTYNE